jgi:hypothetical protein
MFLILRDDCPWIPYTLPFAAQQIFCDKSLRYYNADLAHHLRCFSFFTQPDVTCRHIQAVVYQHNKPEKNKLIYSKFK